MGPDNVGGRVRAFLIDKTNPNKFYVGGRWWWAMD